LFFAAVAAGTLIGGPLGDRLKEIHHLGFNFGSGSLTFFLLYANFLDRILSVVIGIVIASAFSAILVFARIDAG
jgi:FSR family fosmidomycin resistance protein-like MFS transporter